MKNEKNRIIFMSAIITMLLFVGLTFCGNPTKASAATRKCYLIGTSNERVYSNTGLTKGIGWIYPSDVITVKAVYSRYTYVSYPISGNRTKSGYIRTSAILLSTGGSTYTNKGSFTTYRRPGGSKYGTSTKGDSVMILGTSGSYTQIKYNVSGGYKYAFALTSDVNNYVTGSASSSVPVANGTYTLVSALNNNYVVDIADGSLDTRANCQLYESNGTDAQKFTLTYNSDGYYTIANIASGKMLDCAYGSAENGTNVWQHDVNGSTAQQWKITSVGNGYYTFACRCNGKMLDVSGGYVYNGNNIQIYESNGTNAQKWKLVPVSSSAVEANITSLANSSVGELGTVYQSWAGISRSTDWCVAYATYIGNRALINAGKTTAQANAIVPKQTSTAYMVKYYNSRGLYHSFASWYNPSRGYGVSSNTTLNAYTPKVGDLVAVDNNGAISTGPEHTAIVIAVNGDSITTAEGNTGSGTAATRRVKTYTYKKGATYWQRSDWSKAKIVGFCSPQY